MLAFHSCMHHITTRIAADTAALAAFLCRNRSLPASEVSAICRRVMLVFQVVC